MLTELFWTVAGNIYPLAALMGLGVYYGWLLVGGG